MHNATDFGGAIEGWRALLADFPTYDMVRFNLACALSRTGAFAAAREELRIVLHNNLPKFSPWVLEDDDLAPFRESAHGSLVQQEVASLTSLYAEAATQGVPGVLRRSVSNDQSDGTYQSTETIVRGVYHHTTRRFVPLHPPLRRVQREDVCADCLESTDVLVGLGGTRTLTIRSGFIPNHGISAPSLSFYRGLSGEAEERYQVTDPGYGQIMGFEACASASGFRFRGINPEGWQRWRNLPRAATLPEETALCIRDSASEFDGSQLRETSAGFSVASGALMTPTGSIPLPQGTTRGHLDSIVAHADGTHIAFASHTTRNDAGSRHLVVMFNASTGETERLSAGEGLASMRLGADGALYVQVEEFRGVRRYDLALGVAPEETLAGLRLF